MLSPEDIYRIILIAPALLLSLTVHEYAHARTALAFGDPTAKLQGRVTLNPLAHLDPIGTIVLILSQFIGWAKPVPVNPMNLRPRRLGDIMVSLAGPLSNLSLAVVCGLVLRGMWAWVGLPGAGNDVGTTALRYTYVILFVTMLANIGLGIFNLIPLFPLDGHHILRESLPTVDQRTNFMAWQVRYGVVVLAALIFMPRLLSMVLHRETFSPVGWLYGVVAGFALNLFGLWQPYSYISSLAPS